MYCKGKNIVTLGMVHFDTWRKYLVIFRFTFVLGKFLNLLWQFLCFWAIFQCYKMPNNVQII